MTSCIFKVCSVLPWYIYIFLFFNFWRNLHIIFHSGCTNLKFYQQYVRVPFSLHSHWHLFLISCILDSCSNKCEVISLWFWFAFLWWLVILGIFSCIYWSFGCFLWKKCLFSLSAHLKIWLFYCYWVVWVLYTLDVNPLSSTWFVNFFPILWVSFSLWWLFLLLCGSF